MRNVRLVALAPVLAGVLLGCGAEAAPQPAPLPAPPSASPTPTASPRPSLPPEAAAPTLDGAAATATYFYEELGRALVSQDTSVLRALSTPACDTCLRFADTIDREREDGQRFEGGQVEVKVAASTSVPGDRAVVVLVYSAAPLQRVDVPSTPVPRTDGVRLNVQLLRQGETWLIDKIARVTS